jgi:hypothetical protein
LVTAATAPPMINSLIIYELLSSALQ